MTARHDTGCVCGDCRPTHCIVVGCANELGGPRDTDRFCATCNDWIESERAAMQREGQVALDAKEHGDAS